MKTLNYKVIFRPEPEGGYTALAPSLPGCISYGRTIEESSGMIRDAIKLYIKSLKKHGESIHQDSDNELVSQINVNL